jgi:hypothetical protein
MMGRSIRYHPMSRRNRMVFALAFVAMLVALAAFAFARIRLIGWWLDNCRQPSQTCDTAMFAVNYWWAFLLLSVGAIAFVAHRLTLDRLTPME